MCGIVGYTGKKHAQEIVIDSLKKSDDEILKTAELVRSKVLDLCNKFPLY